MLELIRCLRNEQCDQIDLVASFIMESRLAQLAERLLDAIDRGRVQSPN